MDKIIRARAICGDHPIIEIEEIELQVFRLFG
jgi:hypothetical protein